MTADKQTAKVATCQQVYINLQLTLQQVQLLQHLLKDALLSLNVTYQVLQPDGKIQMSWIFLRFCKRVRLQMES